jgi:hypothetical protein
MMQESLLDWKPSQYEREVMPMQEAAHGDWLALARATAIRMGQRGVEMTVDQVRAVCPPPPGVDPRVMAAIFPRKRWERVGYAPGFRKASHARPVCIFKLRAE